MFTITARAAAEVTSSMSVKVGDANPITISLPNKGASGKGIDVSGNATTSDSATYANDNNGFGWEYRFIEFDVKDFLPREYDDNLVDKGPASPEYIAKRLESYKKEIYKRYKNEQYWEDNKQYYPDCKSYEDWLVYVDENFGEICLWNTPIWFDIFLIRNCPVGFIQDRLKEQYDDLYNDILNKTGEFTERKAKVGHSFKLPGGFRKTQSLYDVFVYDKNGNDLFYNKKANRWINPFNTMADYDEYYLTIKNVSKQKIKRLVNRWKLESGSVVKIVSWIDNKPIRIVIK